MRSRCCYRAKVLEKRMLDTYNRRSTDQGRTVQVQLLSRRVQQGTYSIERVFQAVQQYLPLSIKATTLPLPFASRGLFRRLGLIVYCAIKGYKRINHIAGDVHFVALGLRKRNTILTIHDCYHLRTFTGVKRFIYKLVWFDMPIARSALISAISERTRFELIEFAPWAADKIVVIPDCVMPEFFDHECPPQENRIPIILQIGTRENKNLDRVIQALEDIPCQLRIIGRPSREQLRLLCSKRTNFVTRADLTNDELIAEYAGCDLVVFASTYEGFGLPIVEANAIGRPVITSDIPPMRDVAGKAAHLVDPYSADSIRAGVQKVLHDSAYRWHLIAAGRENAQKYNPVRVASMYAELYERVAHAS